MSSSRRARRRRRHERYGKPSYPSLPKNGLTPAGVIIDEWVGPYSGEDSTRVITSEMIIDWGRSYISYDFMTPTLTTKDEKPVRYFRTNYLLG